MADPDARRRAEEALRRVLTNAAAIVRLSWSDGATPSDRANLERIKSAAADIAQDHKILRALLAAGPGAVCTPGCACGAPHEPDDEDPCACPCHEPDGTPASSDAAVREAAEVVRTILTAHDARLSESGALTYGPPSRGTGFVAAIQWLRRYDAARGGE